MTQIALAGVIPAIAYYVAVDRTGGEFPSDGNYWFRLAGGLSPRSADLPANGRSITSTPTGSVINGYVGRSSIDADVDDPFDFYRFTLTARTPVRLLLSDLLQPGLAGLQLFRDDNGTVQRRAGMPAPDDLATVLGPR